MGGRKIQDEYTDLPISARKKWILRHPEAAAAARKKWLHSPKGIRTTYKQKHRWLEKHPNYMKEYHKKRKENNE